MPEWLSVLNDSPLAGGIASGLLFLGGLRVELRNLHEKVAAAISSATRAHVRIDAHIDKHHVRRGQ